MAKAPADLAGRSFGRLTAVRRIDDPASKNHRKWACICSCGSGKTTHALAFALVNAKTQSCGCIRAEQKRLLFTQSVGKRENVIARREAAARDLESKLAPYRKPDGDS